MQLSIVITVYQVVKYLQEAIESCLQFREFAEVIVVVDGVNERIQRAVEIIVRQNSLLSIKVIYLSKNQGTFLARKQGVLQAAGDYITFLDADDYFSKEASVLLNAQLLTTRVDCILFQYQYNGRVAPLLFEQGQYTSSLSKYLLDYPEDFVWSSAGKIYQRDILHQVYKDLSSVTERLVVAEDLLLYATALKYIKKFSFLRDIYIYIYRVHSESITQKWDSEMIAFKLSQLKYIKSLLIQMRDANIALEGGKSNYSMLLRMAVFKLTIDEMGTACAYQKSFFMRFLKVKLLLQECGIVFSFYFLWRFFCQNIKAKLPPPLSLG